MPIDVELVFNVRVRQRCFSPPPQTASTWTDAQSIPDTEMEFQFLMEVPPGKKTRLELFYRSAIPILLLLILSLLLIVTSIQVLQTFRLIGEADETPSNQTVPHFHPGIRYVIYANLVLANLFLTLLLAAICYKLKTFLVEALVERKIVNTNKAVVKLLFNKMT